MSAKPCQICQKSCRIAILKIIFKKWVYVASSTRCPLAARRFFFLKSSWVGGGGGQNMEVVPQCGGLPLPPGPRGGPPRVGGVGGSEGFSILGICLYWNIEFLEAV